MHVIEDKVAISHIKNLEKKISNLEEVNEHLREAEHRMSLQIAEANRAADQYRKMAMSYRKFDEELYKRLGIFGRMIYNKVESIVYGD